MRRSYLVAAVALIAVLGVIETQFHLWGRWRGARPLGQRELATQVLGHYLAQHCAGSKAIVMSNPFTQTSGQPSEVYQYEKAGLRGLRRGLGGAVTLEAVVFPELRPECQQDLASVYIDPATTTPLSYLVAPGALDAIVQKYPQARIIVSLIGLPVDLRDSRTWTKAGDKTFALLLPDLRMVGRQEEVRQAVLRRQIMAMVLNKPGGPAEDQPLGGDLKMEFDRRYLLVTSENVDSLLKLYPRLF
jgi:hypothetical protein